MKNVIVIGGGPSGMMASLIASKNANVILIEKNEKLGKKLYITGKGRCNITNYCEPEQFLTNVVNGQKFVKGAIYRMSPYSTYSLFESLGLKLKVERGNRVFPESDKASDVTKTLENAIKKVVNVKLNENVTKIEKDQNFKVTTNKGVYVADKVIVCTGGVTYSTTGSTGDGYLFAKQLGHKIKNPVASLVGIKSEQLGLQGLSLKNVTLNVYVNDIKKYSEFGEMLFTHSGISGPIVLTVSAFINRIDKNQIKLYLDLKPALTEEQLENRLLRDFNENKNKNLISVIYGLMPKSLAEVFLKKVKISGELKVNLVTKEQRKSIIKTLKNMPLTFNGLEHIDTAIVTSGGVDTLQINPKTMESKLVKDLYFCGEVLDIDALTGGYNIQLALSTAYMAGLACANE